MMAIHQISLPLPPVEEISSRSRMWHLYTKIVRQRTRVFRTRLLWRDLTWAKSVLQHTFIQVGGGKAQALAHSFCTSRTLHYDFILHPSASSASLAIWQ